MYLTDQEEQNLMYEKRPMNQYQALASLAFFNPQGKFLKAPSSDSNLGLIDSVRNMSLAVDVKVGFDHQAKKFPRWKNVNDLWHFDF